MYFCKKGGDSAVLEELRIDDEGEIGNWPDSFFGDEMGELSARTLAAMEHREKRSGKKA